MLFLLAIVALTVGATACMPPLVEPPTSGKNFGQGPLEAVYDGATAKASCGLTAIQLSAMMMAVTYGEAGGPVPAPMTLSRWDNVSVSASNANLFAFGRTSGAYVNAFFSPGIGMWQFDSAGGWPFSAIGAIDSVTSANQAATTISSRWCNAPGPQKVDEVTRRKYAWGPWFGCSIGTPSPCEPVYASLAAGDKLNTAFDSSVTRYGGMQQRICNVDGVGEGLTCWYVNPALVEGSRGWTGGTYNGTSSGVTPLPKPFYVVEAGGNEYRIWLQDDTGYDIGIRASKPITANARRSLTWAATAGLCDLTSKRGTCTGGASPIGSVDSVAPAGPLTVRVQGWAMDQDTTSPIMVHVYVDGAGPVGLLANTSRPDVGLAFPGFGDAHGFDGKVAAPVGQHEVCVYGINVSGGVNQLIACRTTNVTGQPSGSLDAATAGPGRVDVAGWVSVPGDNAAQAIVSIDGVEAGRFNTSVVRPDVVAAVPTASPMAGFAGSVATIGGTHRVCLSADGVAYDALGCRTVSVPTGPPFGSLDVVSAGVGSVSVAGWAIDPDTAAPIQVHVYVGAAGTALAADQRRGDVGAVFPPYGPLHGYSATLAAGAGAQQVCAYAINVGSGGNTLLGCRTVTVPGGQPFGSVDVIGRTGSGISVAGWAIDPDTTASIPVHVYVGSAGYVLEGSQLRPDVGGVFPAYGPYHGFSAVLPDPGGSPTVCAYAINTTGAGGSRLLGCRTL